MTSAPRDAMRSRAAPREQVDERGSRPRRIAFVVSSLSKDRAHRTGLSWVSWYAHAGHAVDVVVMSGDAVADTVPASVRVRRLSSRVGRRAAVRALSQLIDQERYDTVVAVRTSPNLLVIEASRRSSHRPGVVVVAEQDLLSLRRPGSATGRTARRAKRRYRHADVVVSPSHSVAAEMAAGFGVASSRSLVVPNPVLADTDAMTRTSRIPGLSRGVQIVLLGALWQGGNPELAVRAAQVLNTRGVDSEVVSVATGPLEGALADLAGRLGVRYTSLAGADDPFVGLGQTAVALLTSRSEGLGGELVEAAARGIPAVALSTALGVADAVIPGVTGELALDDDPVSVANAVIDAASITVGDIDEWLGRFRVEGSARLLEEAIEYARATRT